MRLRTTALSLLAVFAVSAMPARADFNQILTPTVAYTSSTTLIDISSIPDGTSSITSVTQGAQTISFDQPLTRGSIGNGWATWGSPPDTETNNPPVLFQTSTNTLQMLLSVPSTTFGFELQGNQFNISEFSVQFFEGAVPVGNAIRFVDGNGGARLFAGSTTDTPFTSIVITNVDGQAGGFAVAQIRFTPVPEPASVAMAAQAILAVGFYGWRKRRQAARKA